MRQLTIRPTDFYKKALVCAHHYGFSNLDELAEVYQSPEPAKKFEKRPGALLDTKHKKVDQTSRELEATLKRMGSRGIVSVDRPLLFYTTNFNPDECKYASDLPKNLSFGLHIVGMKQSIAEAILLKTASTIVEELGEPESYAYINSIGDKDSSMKFVRDTTNHLRKHINELPTPAREAFKEDVFLAYSYITKKKVELPEEMPRPMEFLTSGSRKHMREVLEYLEAADLAYIFDDQLIGHRECYNHTLFELRSNADPTAEDLIIYARGGRYDELARQYFKTHTPATGIIFTIDPEAMTLKSVKEMSPPRIAKRPRVFFIRLGYAAELKSFTIMEMLRRARIPMTQNLHTCALSEQLQYAEQDKIPYTMIMGQKEALEECVIVRDTATRAQQTVSVDLLPSFFKQGVK